MPRRWRADEIAVTRFFDELDMIAARGLCDQFLAVADEVRDIRDKGILVGPGRGATASSIVFYLLGVTAVDPLANGLLFERFITWRNRPVEIDVDVAASSLSVVAQSEVVEGRNGRPLTRRLIKSGGATIDVLGLNALDRIAGTLALAYPEANPNDFLARLSLDDAATFDVLSSAQRGPDLFQFASPGARKVLKDLQPRSLEALTTLLALYRPSHFLELQEYVRRATGVAPATGIEETWDITEPTLGLIIYQEQVMQMAMRIGGLSGTTADRLRQALGKRQTDHVAEIRGEFFEGAERLGYRAEVSQTTWDQMQRHGNRAFCRAHAAAYALISYWDAYTQAHFSDERDEARKGLESHPNPAFPDYPRQAESTGIAMTTWSRPVLQPIRSGEVAMLLSVPGAGATRFLAEMAMRAAGQGCEVIFLSFSPYAGELDRILDAESGVRVLKGVSEVGEISGQDLFASHGRHLLVIDRLDLERSILDSGELEAAGRLGRELLATAQITGCSVLTQVRIAKGATNCLDRIGVLGPLEGYADVIFCADEGCDLASGQGVTVIKNRYGSAVRSMNQESSHDGQLREDVGGCE